LGCHGSDDRVLRVVSILSVLFFSASYCVGSIGSLISPPASLAIIVGLSCGVLVILVWWRVARAIAILLALVHGVLILLWGILNTKAATVEILRGGRQILSKLTCLGRRGSRLELV